MTLSRHSSKLLLSTILGGLLASLALLLIGGRASAHDRGDFLPSNQAPTYAVKQVMNRGYGTYKLDSRANTTPGVRSAIWACYQDQGEKTGIWWYEVPSDQPADLTYSMPDNFPGGMGVVGLAYYSNAPALIQLNAFVGVVVWGSAVCHEHGHIDLQEDLYIHPLTCDSTARYTRMSCGTFIGLPVDPYDVWVVWNTYIPDLPSQASAQRIGPSTVRLSYNGIRASSASCTPYSLTDAFTGRSGEKDNYCGHFSRNLDNATRVAIFRSVGGSPWVLVGYGPVPSGAAVQSVDITDDPGCGGIRYALRPESAIPATWLGGVPFLSGDLKVLENF